MKSSSSKSTSTTINALEYMRANFPRPTFGQLVESLRICDEISQADLARKLGVSRQDLNNIEKGRTKVSIERAMKLGKIMGYGEESFARYVVQDMLYEAGLEVEVSFNKMTG